MKHCICGIDNFACGQAFCALSFESCCRQSKYEAQTGKPYNERQTFLKWHMRHNLRKIVSSSRKNEDLFGSGHWSICLTPFSSIFCCMMMCICVEIDESGRF